MGKELFINLNVEPIISAHQSQAGQEPQSPAFYQGTKDELEVTGKKRPSIIFI
jgi:hypothetical protein